MGARLTNGSREDSLPPIEIGCCRFRSLCRVAETRVYAVSAGGGMGWGVVPWSTEVPHLPTPTPDPSPQGGGEESEATSSPNLAPFNSASVRQAERDIFARVAAAADGHDDVLLAIHRVRHRIATLRRRHEHGADLLSGRLVVGS